MRVLLIEDDAELQKATMRLIRRAFSGFMMTIDVADAPKSAIALLEANTYDFVLSDFNIKGGTGGEVLTWITKNQKRMVERFVFFSGADHLDHLHNKVIDKGISPAEFVSQLHHHIYDVVIP